MGHVLSSSGRSAAVVAAVLIALLLAGCGGSETPTVSPNTAPALAELEDLLAAELERLGKDLTKDAAQAPTGADNAVLFLTAEVTEPGVPVPQLVRLSWVEQLVGDYNQDGLVGVADLTPIAQHWEERVVYDQPAVHDGITWWPSGDPLSYGAFNWRLARIDGNHDGLIGLGDITPIAQHWQERLSGYKLCQRNGDDTASELADVPRPEVLPDLPVVYAIDCEPAAAGDWQAFEFFVESWSAADSSAGPASDPVSAGQGGARWAARFELAEVGLHMLLHCDAALDSAGNLCLVSTATIPS